MNKDNSKIVHELFGFKPTIIPVGQTMEVFIITPNVSSQLRRLVIPSQFNNFEIVQIQCGNYNTMSVPCMSSIFENLELLSVCPIVQPRQKILLLVRNVKSENDEFHAAALLDLLYENN